MRREQYWRIGTLAAIVVGVALALLLQIPRWIVAIVFLSVSLVTGSVTWIGARGRDRDTSDGGHFEDGRWVDRRPDLPRAFPFERSVDPAANIADVILDVGELLGLRHRRRATKPDGGLFSNPSDGEKP
jgi:hypothetical protein